MLHGIFDSESDTPHPCCASQASKSRLPLLLPVASLQAKAVSRLRSKGNLLLCTLLIASVTLSTFATAFLTSTVPETQCCFSCLRAPHGPTTIMMNNCPNLSMVERLYSNPSAVLPSTPHFPPPSPNSPLPISRLQVSWVLRAVPSSPSPSSSSSWRSCRQQCALAGRGQETHAVCSAPDAQGTNSIHWIVPKAPAAYTGLCPRHQQQALHRAQGTSVIQCS